MQARTCLLLALLASVLSPLAHSADDVAADSPASAPRNIDDVKRAGNVLKLRKTTPPADHTTTIESFVQLAATQSIDAVYKTFADEPVQANGELALKTYLASEVMPFFADVERLDRHWRVVGATFADDSTGQIAYAYVVTKDGRIKPFTIAWRVENNKAKLMDVKVDRCVQSRHPVLPGGCER